MITENENLFHWRHPSFWVPVLIAAIGGISIGSALYVWAFVFMADNTIELQVVLAITGTILMLLPGAAIAFILTMLRYQIVLKNVAKTLTGD